MQQTTKLGLYGEELVAQHLQKDGFTILEKNYRQRCGEIDIIAQKNDLLVFVEVKLRRSEYFDLSHVITRSKQRKIITTAKIYLAYNKVDDTACRFDVAFVTYTHKNPDILYIPHAFQEVG